MIPVAKMPQEEVTVAKRYGVHSPAPAINTARRPVRAASEAGAVGAATAASAKQAARLTAAATAR